MFTASHSSLREISMSIAMTTHDDNVNLLVVEEFLGVTVVSDVWIVCFAMLALG
jgi:hypothetical protein